MAGFDDDGPATLDRDALEYALAEAADREYRLTDRWEPLKPHDVQSSLVWHPARIKVVPPGRRSGKTELAKRCGIVETLQDRPFAARIGYGAPTYSRALEIYFEDLEKMIPRDWIRRVRRSMNIMEFELLWGAKIRLFGMNNPKIVEGPPWDQLFLDEVADYPTGCLEDNVLPAIETLNRPGKAWFLGVPDEVGPNQAEYEKYWELGLRYPEDPDVCSFWWPSSDILSPESIARNKERYDEIKFRQEYGGEFVKSNGKAFPMFSYVTHVDAEMTTFSPSLPVDFLFDFGSRTGTGLVGQNYRGNVWIMDETSIDGGSTDALVAALIDVVNRRRWPLTAIGVYGDPAGRTPSSPTGVTDYQILRESLVGYRVIWNQLTAPVPIVDTVNVTRRALKAASGRISLYIHPRCVKLIEDMKNADWPAANNLKEFHRLAALRYYLIKLFGGTTTGVVGSSTAELTAPQDQKRFSSRYAG
jgi:hypothetical protein